MQTFLQELEMSNFDVLLIFPPTKKPLFTANVIDAMANVRVDRSGIAKTTGQLAKRYFDTTFDNVLLYIQRANYQSFVSK